MRISDWSSDVCSSDLLPTLATLPVALCPQATSHDAAPLPATDARSLRPDARLTDWTRQDQKLLTRFWIDQQDKVSTEDRRVGNVFVSTRRSRFSQTHNKKKAHTHTNILLVIKD